MNTYPKYTHTTTVPGRVVMEDLRHKALKQELVDYLNEQGWDVTPERPFREFIGTDRKFRADFYASRHHYSRIPSREQMIIEINGGQWVNGRHNRGGKNYERDLTKSNIANRSGIPYFQYTYEMLANKDYEQDF